MSKGQSTRRDQKKKPAKTMQEKKNAKREKQQEKLSPAFLIPPKGSPAV